MSEEIDHVRRRFLAAAAMTVAAVPFGVAGCAARRMTRAGEQLPVEGELPPLGGATGQLNSPPFDWGSLKSPENYVGYERTENFASPGGAVSDKSRVYAAPARLGLNQWALAGDWTVGKQAVVLNEAGGRIACRFHARDLHLVMGPAARGASVRFRVTLDGGPAGAAHGLDVDDKGNGTVAEQRLYQLIRQPKPVAERQFEIEFLDPGVEAFAFTFG